MMEKYGTLEVWENTKTGEVKEIQPGEKLEGAAFWVRLKDEEEKIAEIQREGVVDV